MKRKKEYEVGDAPQTAVPRTLCGSGEIRYYFPRYPFLICVIRLSLHFKDTRAVGDFGDVYSS